MKLIIKKIKKKIKDIKKVTFHFVVILKMMLIKNDGRQF